MAFRQHTRGDTPGKNKPQAYLFAAPEDAAEQEEVLSLLLDMTYGANLCVWTNDSLPEHAQLEQLGDMSLFVLVMTKRLAGEYTEAAAQAVRFCYEHKIPLLPVYYISPSSATEPAGSFYRAASIAVGSRKGRLELDGPRASSKDFKDQFAMKLHALVMSDELSEEIRKDAFKKQIFLSYRKIDREQALAVMKAIHDLPLCESLAIWFDDFLIAGQDFNDEILKQLLDSDAFALTVTDHLTEADKNGRKNYVQREEWPRAAQSKKEEKRILVETGNTDSEKLSKEMDPPVTGTIPVGDSEALREAIIRASLLDESGGEPTARQKYLLGMAYLSGIRVEKDEKRALRLLTESADAGCGEAALQLGFMYLARVGVERDNDEARRWKERAFDLADQQFLTDAAQSLNLAYRTAFGSDGLVLMEYATDHPEMARNVCRQMRSMLEHAPESAIDSETKKVRLAQTWLDESQIHFEKPAALSQETLAEHRKNVEKGLRILEGMPSLDDEGKYQLALGCGELGDIAQWQNRFEEAQKSYYRGIEILKVLADTTGSIIYRRSLAGFWDALGNLYRRQMEWEKARNAFGTGLRLSEAIYAERGLPNDMEGLAISLHNYGSLLEDTKEGEKLMTRAVELLEKNVEEDPQDPYLREELESFRADLKKQKRKPLVMKLISLGIILIIGGAVVGGIFYLVSEILA